MWVYLSYNSSLMQVVADDVWSVSDGNEIMNHYLEVARSWWLGDMTSLSICSIGKEYIVMQHPMIISQEWAQIELREGCDLQRQRCH